MDLKNLVSIGKQIAKPVLSWICTPFVPFVSKKVGVGMG